MSKTLGKRAAARGGDAREVAQRLGLRIEALAGELLGKPAVKTARVWRFGRKGSLVVNVGGPRAGRWYSFEAGQGGDALDLVAWVRQTRLSEALSFGRAWLGGRP
jgi:hypothetical protein